MQPPETTCQVTFLPSIRRIGPAAPLRWLGGAWRDLWRAPGACLAQGAALAVVSAALCYAIYATQAAFWVMALTFGFVFIAPVLAMGLYETGRLLEQGERPSLGQVLRVRGVVRQDLAYLGLLLLLIYFLWGRLAQIVYGMSTFQLHDSAPALIDFALRTPEGHAMLLTGSLVGGAVAFLTFALTAVSAPMLLDPKGDVFAAVATSVRAVATNPGPMLLWALMILALLTASAASGFLLMIVVFPWLGLASWRAYREIVIRG